MELHLINMILKISGERKNQIGYPQEHYTILLPLKTFTPILNDRRIKTIPMIKVHGLPYKDETIEKIPYRKQRDTENVQKLMK